MTFSTPPPGRWTVVAGVRPAIDQVGKEKFQGIDVEQYDEQENGVENDRARVLQVVAAEEGVLFVPDLHQQRETDREWNEAAEGGGQFRERLGNLQRNHQQGDREGKDRIAQTFDARDLTPAPAESFRWLMLHELLPQHGRRL